MKLQELAAAVGKGLFAGAAGTAAMTVSSTLEMKRRGRPASAVPATAVAKVLCRWFGLRVEPASEQENERFSTLAHWGYGTSLGAIRGVLATAGLSGPAASAAHFGAVWGGELVMLPALDIGVPPVWKWGAKEVGIDAFHHLVYATAAGVTYELLDR